MASQAGSQGSKCSGSVLTGPNAAGAVLLLSSPSMPCGKRRQRVNSGEQKWVTSGERQGLVGEVSSITNEVRTVTLPDGSTITAKGVAEIGQTVFIRGGVIDGIAPSLTVVEISV